MSFTGIIEEKRALRAYKKFQCSQHAEMYLLALEAQDKAKMELPLDMVSKHTF